MRSFYISLVLFFTCALASAQAPPPDDATESSSVVMAMAEAPLLSQPSRLQQMKNMIKLQVNRAIDGKAYQSVSEWQPLTARQKFDVFLRSTYSPRTFANAAIDEAADRAKGRHLNREYETGFRGVGQALSLIHI